MCKPEPNPELDSPRSEMNASKRNMKPKVDPVDLSRKLLLACNVTRDKSPNVAVLKKGSGRMFFQGHTEPS